MKSNSLTIDNRRRVLAIKAEIRGLIKSACEQYVGKSNRSVAYTHLLSQLNVISTQHTGDIMAAQFNFKGVSAVVRYNDQTKEIKLCDYCDAAFEGLEHPVFNYHW